MNVLFSRRFEMGLLMSYKWLTRKGVSVPWINHFKEINFFSVLVAWWSIIVISLKIWRQTAQDISKIIRWKPVNKSCSWYHKLRRFENKFEQRWSKRVRKEFGKAIKNNPSSVVMCCLTFKAVIPLRYFVVHIVLKNILWHKLIKWN